MLKTLFIGWQSFLNSLDTKGGHIFLFVFLMGAGVTCMHFGLEIGKDFAIGSFGALMRGVGDPDKKDSTIA